MILFSTTYIDYSWWVLWVSTWTTTVDGNNRGTLPEPIPARDIAPSTTLSKATVDFSSAVVAFMRVLVLVLRKSNTDNSSSCTFFHLVTSVLCAACTFLFWLSIFKSSWPSWVWWEITVWVVSSQLLSHIMINFHLILFNAFAMRWPALYVDIQLTLVTLTLKTEALSNFYFQNTTFTLKMETLSNFHYWNTTLTLRLLFHTGLCSHLQGKH